MSLLLKSSGAKGDVQELRTILERLAKEFRFSDAKTESFVWTCPQDLLERGRRRPNREAVMLACCCTVDSRVTCSASSPTAGLADERQVELSLDLRDPVVDRSRRHR